MPVRNHGAINGFSWQLGVFLAHALEASGRLAKKDDEAGTVILTTGEVGRGALQVNGVGYVDRKIEKAFDRLRREAAAGRRVITFWPNRD
jgi:hypothetical protein